MKYNNKKALATLAASLVHLVISLIVKIYKCKKSYKSKKRIYGQKFLVTNHPLSNIDITNSFNYEPRFNGVYSRNNLPGIKDET